MGKSRNSRRGVRASTKSQRGVFRTCSPPRKLGNTSNIDCSWCNPAIANKIQAKSLLKSDIIDMNKHPENIDILS